MEIEKPWGYEEIIVKTGSYVVKKLHIKAKHRLSLQSHVKKEETIIALEGSPAVSFGDGKEQWGIIARGGFIHIPCGRVHRMMACGSEDAVLLEVSTPELDDMVRYEDDYGRV